jgi:hypothetical protein
MKTDSLMRAGVAFVGGTRASPADVSRGRGPVGEPSGMISEASFDEMAALVLTLADLAERVRAGGGTAPSSFDGGAGPLASFSAVIDALARDLEMDRSEVVRRLVDEMRKQIATDHAMLALLLTLDGTVQGGPCE